MSLPKILALFALLLFGTIGVVALLKHTKQKEEIAEIKPDTVPTSHAQLMEFDLVAEEHPVPPKPSSTPPERTMHPEKKETPEKSPVISKPKQRPHDPHEDAQLPNANRIEELFNKCPPQLPIVETITYKSRVAWQKGRPAWLSDYASHYRTSRHFIARSLNGKADYFKQDVADGDRFNVLRESKNIRFHIVVDNSRCKMWFYYLDVDADERVLLKRYDVGLGREDNTRVSGYLTPIGKYSLGSKIATYKPTMMGYHNGQKVEMIRVFGTRWIPFEKEIANCSLPAKGFGIHGVPWVMDASGSGLAEDRSSIGQHYSDGCIRMAAQDIEELFAIIITRPTLIEIVSDYRDAELPGKEKKAS